MLISVDHTKYDFLNINTSYLLIILAIYFMLIIYITNWDHMCSLYTNLTLISTSLFENSCVSATIKANIYQHMQAGHDRWQLIIRRQVIIPLMKALKTHFSSTNYTQLFNLMPAYFKIHIYFPVHMSCELIWIQIIIHSLEVIH